MAHERQKLTFSSADIHQSFGLRATGTSELFKFRISDYADTAALIAGIESGIEGLAAYDGVMVSGSGSLSGTSTKTGDLTFEFDAEEDVAELEVRSGAVTRQIVSAGDDDADYSFDGGGSLSLGISQANFQTNQRSIGGAHSNVVCIGSSTDAIPSHSTFNVTGAPSTAYNGHYVWYDDDDFGNHFYNLESDPTYDLWYTIGELRYTLSRNTSLPYVYSQDNESLTPTGSTWPNGITLTEGAPTAAVPGDLDFKSYFPVDVSPGSPSRTGTNSTNTTLIAAGSAATTITVETTRPGGALTTTNLTYNYLDADGVGAVVDRGAATATGWSALFQVADSRDEDASIIASVYGSATGAFAGEKVLLCTFEETSVRGAELIVSPSPTTSLLRYLQVDYIVDGGADPGFAINVSVIPHQLGDQDE